MTPALLRLAGLLALLLLTTACATFGTSRGVSVALVNVLPTNASLFETSATLTVRYTNETTQPLVLGGSSHRLYLNESYVGRAVSNQRLTVPALSTVTQDVTVHLENLTLVRKLTQVSQTRAPVIAYRLECRLHPAEGSGFGDLRAIATGELDVSALAGALRPPPAGR